MPRPFLTAEWRHLVMLNFEADPAVVAPLVPRGTALDLWQGRCLVSVVGFRFLKTRVRGLAIPGHRNFPEVNLRFYVRRDAPDGPRRAVAFVREIVPRRAIAWTARLLYGENYAAHPMTEAVAPPDPARDQPGRAAYRWHAGGRWHAVEAAFSGAPAPPERDGEAEFIAEHYWGYARRRGGRSVEYRVEHPPWRVWRPDSARLDLDAAAVYGPAWAPALSAPPCSAFVAEGSAVAISAGSVLVVKDEVGRMKDE